MIKEKWHYVGTTNFEFTYTFYEEYLNEDETKCKRVWDDGSIEIFDLA